MLLVHPGGPFWAKRDEGAWSIPKGEMGADENEIEVARREFGEELGSPAPEGGVIALGEARQKGGKIVHVWAAPGDFDVDRLNSNTFELEWPPRSGRTQRFPEVDRARWFDLGAARTKLVSGQLPFLDRLEDLLR